MRQIMSTIFVGNNQGQLLKKLLKLDYAVVSHIILWEKNYEKINEMGNRQRCSGVVV